MQLTSSNLDTLGYKKRELKKGERHLPYYQTEDHGRFQKPQIRELDTIHQ
jgi:hypothetical protein